MTKLCELTPPGESPALWLHFVCLMKEKRRLYSLDNKHNPNVTGFGLTVLSLNNLNVRTLQKGLRREVKWKRKYGP